VYRIEATLLDEGTLNILKIEPSKKELAKEISRKWNILEPFAEMIIDAYINLLNNKATEFEKLLLEASKEATKWLTEITVVS